MDRRDELDDMNVKPFLELTTITGLAAVSTVAALMHGDFFWRVLWRGADDLVAPIQPEGSCPVA